MQALAALIKMFDGSPSEKHTLEVGLEDIRRWHAEIGRLQADRDDAREQRRKWHEASAMDRAENGRLRVEIEQMRPTVMDWTRLHNENERLKCVLEFYATPGTYYAIGFFPDRPCGEFMEDFSDDHGDEDLPGPRPGKAARMALSELTEPVQPPATDDDEIRPTSDGWIGG